MFDPASGEVIAPDGNVTSLRPQTSRVLALLVANTGTVVTKDALMEEVWAGTHVTDDSLVQCISEIRRTLGPEDGKAVATIPKKGYRLTASEMVGAVAATTPASPVGGTRRPHVWPWIAALAVVAVIAGAVWWWTRPPDRDGPVSIAIMPFRNMSGGDDQAYLSNGVAEDLIVSLSQLSDLSVVSRGTAFSLYSDDRDMRDIAEALRVDYVLEGSVRRVADDLRLSASLVDGATGANVWADRYEGAAADMFRFQDEVLEELVRVLSVRLSTAERERLGVRGTKDIAAYDAYLKGRELENLYTKETNLAAETSLDEAIRHDPDFALAYAHLAQVMSFRVENRWSETPDADIRAAFAAAETGVALDPDLPFAHFSLGRLYTRSFAPDADKAVAHYERAIELDPGYLDAYVFLANIHIFYGRAAEAVPLIDEAMGRHPIPPYWYYLAQGMADFFLGNYDSAIEALTVARDQNPTAPFPHRFLIAAYGQMGDVDQAEWSAMEYEALGRTATVAALLDSASIQDPGYRAVFADGFRKAGLPDR